MNSGSVVLHSDITYVFWVGGREYIGVHSLDESFFRLLRKAILKKSYICSRRPDEEYKYIIPIDLLSNEWREDERDT